MTVLHKLGTLPAGRRSKWVIALLWLVIFAAAGPIGSKISTASTTDSTAYLPHSAESTRADKAYRTFPESKRLNALVVYRRTGGLTSADLASVEADRQRLVQRFPETGAPAVSPDRTTAMLTVPVPVSGTGTQQDNERVINAVDAIRGTVGHGTGGVRVAVTGAAAYAADAAGIYADVDLRLLIVTVIVVALLLIVTYRSPWLWAVALGVAAVGNVLAEAVGYLLAKHGGVTMSTLAQGILTVLVFGAGTNYALLLLSRYREELRRHADKHDAMRAALRRTGQAVLAAGGTVIVSLICLSAADLGSTRGLGPIGAAAIVCALAAMLTLLPAVLVICGRWLYWPFVPRHGDPEPAESGFWSRVGTRVRARPRAVWAVTALVLVALTTGLATARPGLNSDEVFRGNPESVVGQHMLAQAFHAAATSSTTVIARAAADRPVLDAVRGTPGVARADAVRRSGDRSLIIATLTATPASDAAHRTITALRDRVHAVPGADAVVGGNDAVDLDIRSAGDRDLKVVVPLVLAAIALLLGLVLRAVTAPVVLIATVILSFAAALGIGMASFATVFGFPGTDPSLPLYAFIFLVAFGIDYNIFLMTRVREESSRLGTRDGVLRGLATTGAVITSAGVLLAATFATLGVIPLVAVTELGVVVALGVLLDTFIVRSVLVPALAFDLSDRVWWPSVPARAVSEAEADRDTIEEPSR